MTNPLRRPTFAWSAGLVKAASGAVAELQGGHQRQRVVAGEQDGRDEALGQGGSEIHREQDGAPAEAVGGRSAHGQQQQVRDHVRGQHDTQIHGPVCDVQYGEGQRDRCHRATQHRGEPGIVPELVYPPQIQKANALLGAAGNATKIVGPGVAGVLVAAVGSGPAIAADAVSFTLAALCLLWLNRSPHTATGIRHSPRRRPAAVGHRPIGPVAIS